MKSYEILRDEALLSLRTFMDSLPEKKGSILAYWIKDYVRFLKKESTFDPQKLVRYKRGSIVKVHLGYRVGSEEGGLHYAIVLDTNNEKKSSAVTVIPLTSIKETTDLTKLHRSRLPLGNELFMLLHTRLLEEIKLAEQLAEKIEEQRKAAETKPVDPNAADAQAAAAAQRIVAAAMQKEKNDLQEKITYCRNMLREVQKMKTGSIALIGQITTVSKIRIYDPLFPGDALSNIRFSDETMDKIDNKVRELFTKQS